MLERVGFEYVESIDPFDGGPHFEAETDEVTLIAECRHARVAEGEPGAEAEEVLVGVARDAGRDRFRAARTKASFEEDRIHLSEEVRRALGVVPGDRVSAIPFV